MASLTRDSDGEGHSGSRIDSIDPLTGKVTGHEPQIGHRLLVGTMVAGTYSVRDWWMTSPVQEIIEQTDDQVRFRTANSVYTLKA